MDSCYLMVDFFVFVYGCDFDFYGLCFDILSIESYDVVKVFMERWVFGGYWFWCFVVCWLNDFVYEMV